MILNYSCYTTFIHHEKGYQALAGSNLAHLSESKRSILQRCFRGELGLARPDSRNIQRRPEGKPLPLSLAEEQIWRRAQASLRFPPFYNESITVHRIGPLNLTILQQSLARFIQRHEIWRTTYDVVDGCPVRVIQPPPQRVHISFSDLSNVPHELREAEVLRLASEELRQPFNLRTGPLVRFTAVRSEDEYYRLFVAAHQIVLDGVSAYNVFFPELVSDYESLSSASRKLPSEKESSIQCADFACWQREWAKTGVIADQLQYWVNKFSNGADELDWPSVRKLPAYQPYRGKIHSFLLPVTVAEAGEVISQRFNTTLFATLFSVFATLLHRYTGQRTIVVGTVTPAGRDESEVQHAMGYFLNPVAIRCEFRPGSRFSQVLQSIREAILGALSHDDVPYEAVSEAVEESDAPRLNPLFKVAASLEPKVPNLGAGWDLTPMDVESGGTRWPLYFVWEHRPTGISGRVQYNPDIWTFDTVTCLVQDFRTLLEIVARNPELRLEELPRFETSSEVLAL